MLVVRIVTTAAYHDVRLVRILIEGEVFGLVWKRRYPTIIASIPGRDIGSKFLQGTDCPLEIQVAQNEKHHVGRTVETVDEVQSLFGPEVTQLVRTSQDIASQRMVREYQFLEIVKNQFRGTVFVTLYLIDDDFYLFFDFCLWKCTVEHDVRQQFGGTQEMLLQESAVHYGLFLVGIGVQVAAHPFHPVQDVPGLPFAGSFEDEVFHKMGHALFVIPFVTGTGIYGIATIGHAGRTGSLDNPQAVRKSIRLV